MVLAAQKYPLKVAVIGCGHIGALHAKAVDESPLAELVGLCDISSEQLQYLSSLYGGIPTFSRQVTKGNSFFRDRFPGDYFSSRLFRSETLVA
jgi:threonine dehydrogenase-like Zn-dependent dehydrogenase